MFTTLQIPPIMGYFYNIFPTINEGPLYVSWVWNRCLSLQCIGETLKPFCYKNKNVIYKTASFLKFDLKKKVKIIFSQMVNFITIVLNDFLRLNWEKYNDACRTQTWTNLFYQLHLSICHMSSFPLLNWMF